MKEFCTIVVVLHTCDKHLAMNLVWLVRQQQQQQWQQHRNAQGSIRYVQGL